jgi:hypothetical protein
MNRRDLIRHLEANGCRLLREGKHSIYVVTPTTKHPPFRVTAKLMTFLVRKICRDLGIPEP